MGIENILKIHSFKIFYKSVSFYQFLPGKPSEKLLYPQASLYFIHMREKRQVIKILTEQCNYCNL